MGFCRRDAGAPGVAGDDVGASPGSLPQGARDKPAGFRVAVHVLFQAAPPERVLLSRRGTHTVLSKMLQSDKQTPEPADRDARAMSEPGVLTSTLNWYRAIPLSDIRRVRRKITVPTMFVWSDGDTALLEKGARDCVRYVSGEYRFEVLHGSHWLLDEQPDEVATLLLDWLAAHPT